MFTWRTDLMLLIVTGSIASGKSEVLRIAEAQGFFPISADDVVHELYCPGALGSAAVEACFGLRYLHSDGTVNRVMLRELVFRDKEALRTLHKCVHPLLFEKIKTLVLSQETRNIALEIVYLDEWLREYADFVWWIARPREACLKVLGEARSFSPELAHLAYETGVIPDRCDAVIDNSGEISALEREVAARLLLFR